MRTPVKASRHRGFKDVSFWAYGYPLGEEVLMGDSVETRCSRCGEEIVVMTAGEYLSSSNSDLDFVLHAHDRESRIAIRSAVGAFACPTCGAHDRLPPASKFQALSASAR
jgi:predicted RNA-binding Zn-ribbon protein involved in translation (DUF1610 family)